jgi:hypothetical protein
VRMASRVSLSLMPLISSLKHPVPINISIQQTIKNSVSASAHPRSAITGCSGTIGLNWQLVKETVGNVIGLWFDELIPCHGSEGSCWPTVILCGEGKTGMLGLASSVLKLWFDAGRTILIVPK